MFFILPLVALCGASSTEEDQCARLCIHDGPQTCAEGSWVEEDGFCHGYFFTEGLLKGDYCYHTGSSAAKCPTEGAIAVRPADVERLIGINTIPADGATMFPENSIPRKTWIAELLAELSGDIEANPGEDTPLSSDNYARDVSWIADVISESSFGDEDAINGFENSYRDVSWIADVISESSAEAEGTMVGSEKSYRDVSSIADLIAEYFSAAEDTMVGSEKSFRDVSWVDEMISDFVPENASNSASTETAQTDIDWEALTVGWDKSVEEIKWLAEILSTCSQTELGRFLTFVTGSSQMPTNLSEFRIKIEMDFTQFPGQKPGILAVGGRCIMITPFENRESFETELRKILHLDNTVSMKFTI
jgi:hypothetical protein